MKSTQPKFQTCAQALLLATLPLAIGQALAATQLLRADRFALSLPGGSVIQMWGYAGDNGSCNTGPVYPAWTPGPAIVVPPGEGLTVTLKNCLTQPTSLVISGQAIAVPNPVWTDGSSGPRYANPASPTDAEKAKRVRSFTHEAPALGSAVYEWTSVKPGTYLYESGTNPQVQVQMGLYGSLTKNADAGNVAYRQGGTDIAYSNQVTLLYSEIDPALHAAVVDGSYGTTGPTSTLDYHPKYFLINGKAYPDAGLIPVATVPAGQKTLLRFLNASLKTHVPTINGQYWKMIAEDGNPYPYLNNPRQQYTAFLTAGKTMDVLLTPSNPGATGTVRYRIFDSRNFDTNNGALGGGMLAYLDVTGASAAAPVFDSAPVTTGTVGVAYSYAAHATDPNGDVVSYSLNPPVVAGMTINSGSGLISWASPVIGTYPVSVRASDTTVPTPLFSDQAYSLVVNPAPVNQPPTARPDSYTAVAHAASLGAQSVSVPGVLGNDTDPEGQALTAAKLTEVTCNNVACGSPTASNRIALNTNGGFTLASTTGTNQVRATYRASDGPNASNSTLTISFVTNRRPTAVADAFTVPRCITGSGTTCGGGYVPLTLNLGSNDTDPDTQTIDVANQLPLAVARVRAGTTGGGSTSGVTTNSRGTVTISGGNVTYRPRLNFAGTDTFQYRVKDKLGLESGDATPAQGSQGWVTVRVTVQ